jgi:hypothetical protein
MKQTYRFARLLAVAGLIAGTLSLWGCGSASTYDPITPTRIVAFGDALVDVGQTGRTVTINGNVTPYRYTVNNVVTGTTTNTSNTFIDFLASYFGFGSVTYAGDSLSAGRLPSTGAYSYGEFGALVSGAAGTKDARGCIKVASTATAYCAYNLQAQIDLFLAQGSPSSSDLFVISIGTGDIMATGIRSLTSVTTTSPYAGLDAVQTALAPTLTTTAAINAQMQTAANALAVQVKRLTDAGAKYVLIMGPPNVGRSPWASESGMSTLLSYLSYSNSAGYTSMGGEGLARLQATFGSTINNPVLYVEIAGLVNTLTSGASAVTTFANQTSAYCSTTQTTTDIAQSIGTGNTTARVSSALCTDTLGTAASYVYADGVNFTPAMQAQLFTQSRVRMRNAAWIN